MYEYELENLKTSERLTIFGYNFQDACERWGVANIDNWQVRHVEYVD